MELTKIKSRQTVVNWTNFIREKVFVYLNSRPKFGGPYTVIEIDENLMCGRRMLIGDVIDGNPDHNSRRQNYGSRVDGPLVFVII